MTATDSPLAAAFVTTPANWSRSGAGIRAIVGHMAEGGGTVTWLSHQTGNSSHYVVEFSGRIVQMVQESRAAGSLNPKLTRSGNDAPFTFEGEQVVYGHTALRKALGADGVSDPNRFVIAIETEGFAKKLSESQRTNFPKANSAGGPNDAQRKALSALVNDIRRRHGAMAVVGHRDQQSYKACPGHRFPWAEFGGHAVKAGYTTPTTPTPSEDTVNSYPVPKAPSVGTVAKGTWLYVTSALEPNADNILVDPGRDLPYLGQPSSTTRIVEYVDASGVHSGMAMFMKAPELTDIRPMPDPTPFAQADVDKVAAALKAKAVGITKQAAADVAAL
jgi:N-acetyl-anhydromuramyl-L-alanine amidase AmpD